MMQRAFILVVFILLVLSAPLLGAVLSDRSATMFTTFPPLTSPAEQPPFSWGVLLLIFLPSLFVFYLLGLGVRRRQAGVKKSLPGKSGFLPWWGWAALILLIISWLLAWSRQDWFASWQHLSFIPLWFSYVFLVNGLCVLRSGRCPLLRRPLFFAALFPLSSLFWWLFEYLNQFVRNWYYIGVNYGPIGYSVHASIAFSTVLPAVYATRELIRESPWFRERFHGLPNRQGLYSPFFAWPVLVVSTAGLVGVGYRPDELFPLLWLAPLLILTSLCHLVRRPTLLGVLARGDWRPAVSAALAALVCGFFWEMWNYFSLAKWIYSIPYVHRFEIFEMPVLGYMGYLPFGILCIELVELFEPADRHGQKGEGKIAG